MKKLSLLKLSEARDLSSDDLKQIKGGSCRAWQCQCHGSQNAQSVDDTLEYRDRDGQL